MRLTVEQAKKYLQCMYRLWLCDEWEQPYDSERCKGCDSDDNCLALVLTISMSDIAKDLLDTFEALQQENEQLRAQVARLREVIIEKTDKLKKIFNKMNYTGYAWMPLDEIDDFLASEVPTDYHNPADVEALRKAKEAFDEIVNPTKYMRKRSPETFDPMRYYGIEDNTEYLRSIAKEALAEIEKAIGGGQE